MIEVKDFIYKVDDDEIDGRAASDSEAEYYYQYQLSQINMLRPRWLWIQKISFYVVVVFSSSFSIPVC